MDKLIDYVRTAIKSVYSDKPIVGKLCFAQAILESNLDGTPSKLSQDCHNLFGIKDIDNIGYKEYWTTECSKGVCRKVVQRFECYKTFEDCIQHHRWLMQRPRYAKVWNSKTFEQACSEVSKAGYATDPKYPLKLIARARDL